MEQSNAFDVIIIGGSYSGLSAAMALGRSLRKVLIIDSGRPCNRQTPHSHNFITQDGQTPAAIASVAKEQVLQYKTVSFIEDKAIRGQKIDDRFVISTESQKDYTAKKLVFATGVKDLMPNMKGFSDCWGISVIHCPYCHGYEVRQQKTGIMTSLEVVLHMTPLIKNLTTDLTVFTNGEYQLDEQQLQMLAANNISVVDTPVKEIIHQNGYLNKLVFEDGSDFELTALYAPVPFEQHSDIPEQLGCQLTDMGHLSVDPFQKTNIDGIFACGDSTVRLRSVAYAVSSGNIAGAVANMELSHEAFLQPSL